MAKNKKTRILIVSPMPPAVGGISVSSDRLRSRLLAEGYEVDSYNLQMDVLHSYHNLWQLVNTLFLPLYVLSRRKYDIIHLHISNYWRRVYLKMILWMFKGAKTVVTFHGEVTYYTNRPLSSFILDAGDRIICVRPGDSRSLPVKLRSRAVEIPAFIMPPIEEIQKMKLPDKVAHFIARVKSSEKPMIIFNGSVSLTNRFHDLYGFEEIVKVSDYLMDKNIDAGILVIVNDRNFDEAQMKFLKSIEQRLSSNPEALIVKGENFSLLPVFTHDKAIYFRPTKTDGDSLSVREALALGTVVVASSVAPRPEDTMCFDLTDDNDMFKIIDEAIDRVSTVGGGSKSINGGFYDKIIDVYNSLLS